MAAYQIDDIDRRVLDIIAKHESGNLGYYAVYPGERIPEITQMTCAQVISYMRQRTDSGIRSSAMGRYQFIRITLVDTCRAAGIDTARTLYSEEVQDMLILTRLKQYRRHNKWKSGELSTDKYMIKLAQEFASMPVPYAMQGASRMLAKGQSYYAGDGLNRAHHDPDTLYTQLEDILAGGTGEVTEIDPAPTGPNGATPPIGVSERTQVERAVSGTGATAAPDRGHAGAQPIPSTALPAAGDVYLYRAIDPLDDRYDFRTGTHVRDIGLYGTDAVAASPIVARNVGEANSAMDSGTAPDTTAVVGSTYDEVPQNPPEVEEGTPVLSIEEIEEQIDQALNSVTEDTGEVIDDAAQASVDCVEPITQRNPTPTPTRVISTTSGSGADETITSTRTVAVSDAAAGAGNTQQFGTPNQAPDDSNRGTQSREQVIQTLLNNNYTKRRFARSALRRAEIRLNDSNLGDNYRITKIDDNKFRIVEK